MQIMWANTRNFIQGRERSDGWSVVQDTVAACLLQLDHKLQHCHLCSIQDQTLDLGVGDTTGGGLSGRWGHLRLLVIGSLSSQPKEQCCRCKGLLKSLNSCLFRSPNIKYLGNDLRHSCWTIELLKMITEE